MADLPLMHTTSDMSRGELLAWINSLLKSNYIKIEQLGTGVAYCQMM